MASTASETRQQMFDFPFNSISKRKLEPEDSSTSLVQENGIFIPRNEKRQRLNGGYKELHEVAASQSYSLPENANPTDQLDIVPDVMDTEDTAMNAADSLPLLKASRSELTENEKTTEHIGTSSSSMGHFQRPRGLNCAAPVVHSYCFENGLLDNLIMNYHGI